MSRTRFKNTRAIQCCNLMFVNVNANIFRMAKLNASVGDKLLCKERKGERKQKRAGVTYFMNKTNLRGYRISNQIQRKYRSGNTRAETCK